MSEFRWFLPTWYGDIRLFAPDRETTRMEVFKLTRSELAAVTALKIHSLKKTMFGLGKPWATEENWTSMPERAFTQGSSEHSYVTLKAPLEKVESFLTKHLRSQHDTVKVTVTSSGSVHEIQTTEMEQESAGIPFRQEALTPPVESTAVVPVAAVTVALPVVGCPAPDFRKAHVRASEVLRTFLSPEQILDFERYQRFITYGGASGRRYMITSRHARSELSRYQRTVFDLEDNIPLCVHEWGIPAAEEMLTMHLLLSLPQWEGYLRHLPE